MATPSVPPTVRTAIIRPVPTPLRSADNAPSAVLPAVGRLSPSPAPITVIQTAVKPYPLRTLVNAPLNRPAAMTAKPSATVTFAPATRTSRSPAAPPATSPPTNGSRRSPEPIAFTPRIAW